MLKLQKIPLLGLLSNRIFLIIVSLTILIISMYYSDTHFSKKLPVEQFLAQKKTGSYILLPYLKVKSVDKSIISGFVEGKRIFLKVPESAHLKVGDRITIEGTFDEEGVVICSFVKNHGDYTLFYLSSLIGALLVVIIFFRTFKFDFKKMEFY